MAGFFFAFLACFLASLGARDQVLVAQMTLRQGARPALLGVALLSTLACCVVAAGLAQALVRDVPSTGGRLIFGGIAMVLAGGEAILLGARKAPEEPTGSLFAALVVLAAMQVTDAVRFLIVGLALATGAPVTAAMGGAAAGVLALGAGWMAPELVGRPELPKLRRLAGLFLLLAGLVLVWNGRSIGVGD